MFCFVIPAWSTSCITPKRLSDSVLGSQLRSRCRGSSPAPRTPAEAAQEPGHAAVIFGRSSEDCGGFSEAVHARRHILVRSTSETVLACLNESRSRKSGRPETPRSPLIPEPEVRGFAWKLSICSSSRIEALSFEIPFLNPVKTMPHPQYWNDFLFR